MPEFDRQRNKIYFKEDVMQASSFHTNRNYYMMIEKNFVYKSYNHFYDIYNSIYTPREAL